MIKKFTVAKLEEIIETLANHAPKLPPTVRSLMSKSTPTISLICGVALIIIVALSVFKIFIFPLSLVAESLISANVYLFQIVSLLMGVIFIISTGKLKQKKLKGWYNLFYISILLAFISVGFFNPLLIGITLFFWYMLYQIKSDFSDR